MTQIGQSDVPHLKPEAALDRLRPKTEMELKTKKQLIQSPGGDLHPHVVLLGAGASRAAFPNGDRSGRIIPLMNDLVKVVGLRPLIKQAGKGLEQENDFEAIYSKLVSNPHHVNIEVVDIVSESTLTKRWSSFTPTLHLEARQNVSESWMARWPRRSREALWFPMNRGSACQEFPMVPTMILSELQEQVRAIAKWEN